jgi:hypothetical protein
LSFLVPTIDPQTMSWLLWTNIIKFLKDCSLTVLSIFVRLLWKIPLRYPNQSPLEHFFPERCQKSKLFMIYFTFFSNILNLEINKRWLASIYCCYYSVNRLILSKMCFNAIATARSWIGSSLMASLIYVVVSMEGKLVMKMCKNRAVIYK